MNSLVGRSQELEDLATLLREGERLITVAGPPGVGKTRLARELADKWPQSHVFFDLSPCGSAGDVLSVCSTQLQLGAISGESHVGKLWQIGMALARPS